MHTSRLLPVLAGLLLVPFVIAPSCGDSGKSDDSGGTPASGTTGTTGTTTGTATGTGTGTGSTVTQECAGPLCVSPVHFDHEHGLGVSPCPDPVGIIKLLNGSAEDATFSVEALDVDFAGISSPTLAVEPDPATSSYYLDFRTGTVPAGSEVEIGIRFQCFPAESHDTGVAVQLANSTDTLDTQVSVAIQVN